MRLLPPRWRLACASGWRSGLKLQNGARPCRHQSLLSRLFPRRHHRGPLPTCVSSSTTNTVLRRALELEQGHAPGSSSTSSSLQWAQSLSVAES